MQNNKIMLKLAQIMASRLTARKLAVIGAALLILSTPFILLFNSLNSAQAQIPPLLSTQILVRNVTTGSGLANFTVAQPGQRLEVSAVVLNQRGSPTATGVAAKVTLASGTVTTSTLSLSATSTNAAPTSDITTVQVFSPGGGLFYVPGSSRVTWDTSGDGIHEFLNTVWQDGITDSGLTFGNVLGGGNTTKVAIKFLVDVLPPGQSPPDVPTPTPTPTPEPPTNGVTPTPSDGGGSTLPKTEPSPSEQVQSQVGGDQNIEINPQITNTNTFNPNIVVAADQQDIPEATTTGQILAAKGELPKTGAAALFTAAFLFFAVIMAGFWARRFGDLPIKRFSFPFAIKMAEGKKLSDRQLVQNRVSLKNINKIPNGRAFN